MLYSECRTDADSSRLSTRHNSAADAERQTDSCRVASDDDDDVLYHKHASDIRRHAEPRQHGAVYTRSMLCSALLRY